MKTNNIDFIANTTTSEAAILILRLYWQVIKNITKAINAFVHKYPWIIVFVVLMTSVILSYINIGQARAERDSYNARMAHMQDTIDTYKALYGGTKK
jgi:hypothetical protein